MKSCLNVFRWFIAVLLIFILLTVLGVGLPLAGISSGLVKRVTIQNWLKDSGIYNQALDLVVEQMVQNLQQSSAVPPELQGFGQQLTDKLKDPNSELRREAEKIISTEKLETSANTVINGVYDWLEGRTDRPTFELTLIDDKEEVTNFLISVLKEQINSLPECPANFQLKADFNPLEATCRPNELKLGELEQALNQRENLDQLNQTLDQLKFSSDNLPLDPNMTNQVLTVFNVLKLVPYLVLGLILFFSLLVILIIPGWKPSLITTAVVLLVPSVIMLATKLFSAALFDFFFSLALSGFPMADFNALQPVLAKVLKTIFVDLQRSTAKYCLYVIIYAVVLLALGLIIRSKKPLTKPAPATEKTTSQH